MQVPTSIQMTADDVEFDDPTDSSDRLTHTVAPPSVASTVDIASQDSEDITAAR